jgi:tRNA-uridine 2-sulfurtransferase
MKVLVAMSGGVDSSAAAALLLDAGHDVTGVHLKMADTPSGLPGKGCCTLDDARDARRVADVLGIPFYVWDLSEAFAERVVDDFVEEYAAGRTPNPCIRCNERVKYVALLARARAVGVDALATGHHVRLRTDETGRHHLHRAVDPGKDQTYVLSMATQEQLAHTLWPCGEHLKADLRTLAAERGLLTAAKPDSTDICFIPSGDLGGFLRPRIAGDTVHVGPRSDLEAASLTADGLHWIAGSPPSSRRPIAAQVRYRAAPLPCALDDLGGDRVRVRFTGERPLAVAPGQAVVLYDGDECLGGATISA